jgi:hypothetical protein
MAVETFVFGIEPEDLNTPIWRFLEFWKFQDLMKGHMYFHRADLYEENDPQEGRSTTTKTFQADTASTSKTSRSATTTSDSMRRFDRGSTSAAGISPGMKPPRCGTNTRLATAWRRAPLTRS